MFSRDRHVRIERVALEHHRDVALAGLRVGDVASPSMQHAAGVRRDSRPARMRSVVVLPEPDGPSSAKNSPGSIVEVDAVQRGDVRRGA